MGRITMAAMVEELAAQRAEMADLRLELKQLRGRPAGSLVDTIGEPTSDAPLDTSPAATPERSVTRRGLMLAAAGAAAGLAASAVRPGPVVGASGGAFILGQTNSASTNTVLRTSAGYGLFVDSTAAAGTCLSGQAKALTGPTLGTTGSSWSTSGTGVAGYATATSGLTYGVYGKASSPTGFALYGNGRMKVTGRSYLGTPKTAPASADLSSGSISFYLDEILNRLRVKVKLSSGVVKYGSLNLA